MRRGIILTGYGLALTAAGLWLVELSGHEAAKRKLRDVEELNRGLQWVNRLQALEIRLLKSEQEIGRVILPSLTTIAKRERLC